MIVPGLIMFSIFCALFCYAACCAAKDPEDDIYKGDDC